MNRGILYKEEKKKYKETWKRKSKRETHQEKDVSFSLGKIFLGISSFIMGLFGFGHIGSGASSTYEKVGSYNAKKYRKIRKKKKHLAKSMQKRMWT